MEARTVHDRKTTRHRKLWTYLKVCFKGFFSASHKDSNLVCCMTQKAKCVCPEYEYILNSAFWVVIGRLLSFPPAQAVIWCYSCHSFSSGYFKVLIKKQQKSRENTTNKNNTLAL